MINLSKGQKVSLDAGIKYAKAGLGWDVNNFDNGSEFDLDASVFMLGAGDKLQKDEDFIFYNNQKHASGSVVHSGDNRTGEGEGDDESIQEIAKYDLSEDASIETAMIFGEIYRHNGEWKFAAKGDGFAGGLEAFVKKYGGNC